MKKYFAGIVGNILEHYDQALYGFLVPFLAPLFFPNTDPVYALIGAYALFPLGLLSKPLGALVFGWMGDRIGRTKVLSITLLGMAATAAAMGFLPTYAQVGWVAPVLLALGRLVQNFFAAGENTGGALYLMEHAKKSHRGWISSLFDMSSIMGIFLASGAAMFWGESWRLLYWAGTITALAGFVVRKKTLKEKPILNQPKMRELLQEWKPLIAISLVIGYSYGNYYMIVYCFNNFLPMISQVSSEQAMSMNTLLLFLDMITLPLFGWLTLRIAKEKLMLAALVAGLLLTMPFFMMLDGATVTTAAVVRIGLMLIGVCFSAPYHAWAMEQCSPRLRFTVCAMGFAIGSRLIGGAMPSLSLWFHTKTGSAGSAAIPVLIAALLAFWPLFKSRVGVAAERAS